MWQIIIFFIQSSNLKHHVVHCANVISKRPNACKSQKRRAVFGQ
jgi:hypothetical protein